MKQTHTPQHYLSTLLPYLGALPFIIANVLLVTGGTSLPPLGEVVHIITVYGLIISVFMSGVHWGQHLHIHQRWSVPLTSLSNINAIILWVGYLVLPEFYFLVLLLISFIYIYVIDYKLYTSEVIHTQYYTTRYNVTSIVVVNLVILLFLI